MTKKHTVSERSSGKPLKTGGASTDARSDARRRLLKVIGGSGSLTLGAVLASGWHKPMATAVLLPAHARSSPPPVSITCNINSADDVDDPGGADIDITFTIFRDGQPITNTGVTMIVEFTFQPSGAIIPYFPMSGEFSLSNGTFSGVLSIVDSDADSQTSVSMTVTNDASDLNFAEASCTDGPENISNPA